MKKIIIAVFGLIVLLGAAGGGLFFMGILDEPLGLNEYAEAEGENGAGAASGEGSDADRWPRRCSYSLNRFPRR